LVIFEILTGSANHFSGGCYRRSARVGRIYPLGNRVGFEEIVQAFEFQPPNDAALAGAVRAFYDRQDGQASGDSYAEFAQHFVVSIPRRSG
jgi:hypothetical protein